MPAVSWRRLPGARDLPFLMVLAGERFERYVADSRVASLELKRGFLSFALEKEIASIWAFFATSA